MTHCPGPRLTTLVANRGRARQRAVNSAVLAQNATAVLALARANSRGHPQGVLKAEGTYQMVGDIHDNNGDRHPSTLRLGLALL